MNTEVILNLITAYLFQHRYVVSKPQIVYTNDFIGINFDYNGSIISICIYNQSFIKIKQNDFPFAICDGIKTFRSEIDRLCLLRY